MITPTVEAPSAASHESWLHDLRNVVSTACVAASVGQRLVRVDAPSAAEMFDEVEQALARCRELLAAATEHVRSDGPSPVPMPSVPGSPSRRQDDARRPSH